METDKQNDHWTSMGRVAPSFQREVAEWAHSVFGTSTRQCLIHLWEELEELMVELCRPATSPYKWDLQDKAREELADCGLITLHLATAVHVQLPEPSAAFLEAMRTKLEVCKKRQWQFRPDGELRHVPDVSREPEFKIVLGMDWAKDEKPPQSLTTPTEPTDEPGLRLDETPGLTGEQATKLYLGRDASSAAERLLALDTPDQQEQPSENVSNPDEKSNS